MKNVNCLNKNILLFNVFLLLDYDSEITNKYFEI